MSSVSSHRDIVSRSRGDVVVGSSSRSSQQNQNQSVERARYASASSAGMTATDLDLDDLEDMVSEPSLRSSHSRQSGIQQHQQQKPEQSAALVQEIAHLRSQLQATTDMNDALRRELDLYETAKLTTTTTTSSTSQSPAVISPVSATAVGVAGVGGSTDSGLAGMTLEEHMVEIRALRLKLEESIKHNEKLRLTLEAQIRQQGNNAGGLYLFSFYSFNNGIGQDNSVI